MQVEIKDISKDGHAESGDKKPILYNQLDKKALGFSRRDELSIG